MKKYVKCIKEKGLFKPHSVKLNNIYELVRKYDNVVVIIDDNNVKNCFFSRFIDVTRSLKLKKLIK